MSKEYQSTILYKITHINCISIAACFRLESITAYGLAPKLKNMCNDTALSMPTVGQLLLCGFRYHNRKLLRCVFTDASTTLKYGTHYQYDRHGPQSKRCSLHSLVLSSSCCSTLCIGMPLPGPSPLFARLARHFASSQQTWFSKLSQQHRCPGENASGHH